MILLVEDNPDDELLAMRALRKSGATCEVRVARDGKQAIEMTERLAPRLVLLDLKLPYLDGHGVITQIRQRFLTRHTPIVVLTTSTEPGDVERAYQLGANSFVQKPVDFLEFVTAMRRIIEYWLETNRVPAQADTDGNDGQGA